MTGQPLTLRCPKCRRGQWSHRRDESLAGRAYLRVSTGITRTVESLKR